MRTGTADLHSVGATRHNAGVLLNEIAQVSAEVAQVSGRRAKIDLIAGLLARAEGAQVPLAVAFLSGELRQRQIGVGYAALSDLLAPRAQAAGPAPQAAPAAAAPELEATRPGSQPAPAAVPELEAAGPGSPTTPAAVVPELTVVEADRAFEAIGRVTGSGSQAERRRLLGALFARATEAERSFLIQLVAGELRQGALEGVMIEAVAQAAGVPAAEGRRAPLGGRYLPA